MRKTQSGPRAVEPPSDDSDLLDRVAAGDQRAFELLYRQHGPAVLGVLHRMLPLRGEAEEVLQEAFLQAWREADRYRPARATARGWLLMLARSRALDRIRANDSRLRRQRAVALDPLRAESEEPRVLSRLQAEEAAERLRQAVDELPAAQGQCLRLAFYEGLTHTQIADRLDQPLGTIKSRIFLGIQKLRHRLAESGDREAVRERRAA